MIDAIWNAGGGKALEKALQDQFEKAIQNQCGITPPYDPPPPAPVLPPTTGPDIDHIWKAIQDIARGQ